MAPSTVAVPFSPAMAVAISPSSSRTPKLRNVRIDYRGDVVRGSATEAPREQDDNGRALDLPKSSNTMEYELADFITAIGGIDNVKEEIWETPAGRHDLGHYRDVTLVSLRIMDAVRQQAGITFPADSVKQA